MEATISMLIHRNGQGVSTGWVCGQRITSM